MCSAAAFASSARFSATTLTPLDMSRFSVHWPSSMAACFWGVADPRHQGPVELPDFLLGVLAAVVLA